MPISGWQWAALMNDGPYNWCTQHSAWGSWISGLEHTAKLICFVKDGRRGEGRLLSFRQERSTWCQERRRCSSCCLCCNPTTPPPHSHTPPLSSPKILEHTHQHIPTCICACTHKHTHHKHSTYSDSTKLERCLDSRPRPHAEPRPLCHHATLISLPGIKKKKKFKYSTQAHQASLDVAVHINVKFWPFFGAQSFELQRCRETLTTAVWV